VNAVVLQPDGKVLIGGHFTSYNGDGTASDYVMRLNADGTRDTSFNAGGSGANNVVYAMAAQSDKKILIGAISTPITATRRRATASCGSMLTARATLHLTRMVQERIALCSP
jgi:hypothetical protein